MVAIVSQVTGRAFAWVHFTAILQNVWLDYNVTCETFPHRFLLGDWDGIDAVLLLAETVLGHNPQWYF